MHRYFLIFSLIIAFISPSAKAQGLSREELERQKKENLQKIKETQAVLNQTRKQKKNSVGELQALNRQISSQEKQLYLMEQDLELIEGELKGLDANIGQLEDKLVALRAEYADMLYRSSKTSGRINQLSFLLSASSFNELVMRYKYIQQYADNRKTQVAQIEKVTTELAERQQTLTTKRTTQQTIKEQQQTEARQLEKMMAEKSQIVTSLSQKEKELRNEIAATQRSVKKLDQRIGSIIQREVARQNRLREEQKREERRRTEAAAAAAATARANENSGIENTPPPPPPPAPEKLEPIVPLIGADFGANQHRIPWPMKNGFVSDRFGVKNHPVLKGVQVDNNGVNIQTSAMNAPVQSVFDGTVMDVSEIPGLNHVVAIQHGEYFTIYANLQQVFVATGQRVSARENIGTAATKDGITEINFQIWKNVSRLNPELWLAGK